MHKPDPVETILARMMPPAMSERGMREIETMLDDLALETPLPHVARFPLKRAGIFGGIAAAGVAAMLVLHFNQKPEKPHARIFSSEVSNPSEILLVGETDRVESMTDEGWREDADGTAMHAMRLNLVEENSLLDEETGIVMKISQPREEYLLMPVSSF